MRSRPRPRKTALTAEFLLEAITHFYRDSRDFNGLPVSDIEAAIDDIRPPLKRLVEDGLVTAVFGDIHPNPHIRAFDPEPIPSQLKKIDSGILQKACLYPSRKHLESIIDRAVYDDRPFTGMLARGAPQLSFRAFDLTILEVYRNDPRFSYKLHDYGGSIYARDQHIESGDLREADQVFLQTIGFGYSEDLERVVIVYLRYLADLSSEHQRLWHARMLSGDFKPHPDYYKTSILGGWPVWRSVFTAFLEELHLINEMCSLMGRPRLFRNEFRGDERPKEFAFMLRPTAREYRAFAHLLDKMIGDNLSRDFFGDEISPHFDQPQDDGSIIRESKGTIRMLSEWLDSTVTFPDPGPKGEMINTFKKVRQERQPGAHAVEEDFFDMKYFTKQRELIVDAYKAVRTLRLIFSNHPAASAVTVANWLQSGKIWTR